MILTMRYATTNDAELIASLSRETFFDSFAEQNTIENMQKHLDEYYAVSKMEEELADKQQVFILACNGETPLGYCKLNEKKKPESSKLDVPIEIERIYAVKTSIGSGVGSFLMQQCIDIARKKNKASLWLGVWEHNKRAIAFYIKWGFEKFGEHIFKVGDDPQTDWLMKKELIGS